MRTRPLLGALLALAACDPEPPAGDPPSFRGDQLECVAPDDAYEPYVGDGVTISSRTVLEPHKGVSVTVDEDNGAVYLDNDDNQIYVCRCDGGCGGSACEITLTPYVVTCTGSCDGVISSDGTPCWGCGWHEAANSGGADGGKLPADPTAGELDPTGFDPKPPTIDPSPGELDPTW